MEQHEAIKKGSLHILIAEDNLINQKVVVRLLARMGHTTKLVENGEEALAALEQELFDVVLMDIQMPIMDGEEATYAIRRRESSSRRHIPIIACTAHAMEGDREHYLAVGMDDYVSKPISSGVLQGKLAEWAERLKKTRPVVIA